MTRVAFLVLDGMPSRHVGPDLTPHLCALAAEAGGPPGTATGVMPSATYPNHATFVTGAAPADHGVVGNWFFVDGTPTPAESVGPQGETLFDWCRAAGRSSAFVCGDQHLVGVMAGDRADTHWPAGGEVPDGARLDAKGYLDDRDTAPHVAEAFEAGHDLVVAHLNGPDTAGHVYGPDAPEALDAYRDTDAHIPALRAALDATWDDTVVILASDHTMEDITHPEPIDVWHLAAEHGMRGLPEGGSALVEGDEEPTWLAEIPGCAGWEPVSPGRWTAWTHPGHWFAIEGLENDYRGMHGNRNTLEQVALVSGGHPDAAALADRARAGTMRATDWAPTIRSLLGLTD